MSGPGMHMLLTQSTAKYSDRCNYANCLRCDTYLRLGSVRYRWDPGGTESGLGCQRLNCSDFFRTNMCCKMNPK